MQWISVDDQLPEDGEHIIFWGKYPHGEINEYQMIIGTYNTDPFGKKWHTHEYGAFREVTHWMPLPKPPKK